MDKVNAYAVNRLRERASEREKEASSREMLNDASNGGKGRDALLLVALELRTLADELEAA
jgi:hypothetical protein